MSRRPRILFVTSVSPYPPTVGGNQRSNLLLRALREVGDVSMVLYTRDGLEDVQSVLERDFGLVEKIPWELAGRTFPFSLLYPFAPGPVQNVAATLRPRAWDYRASPAARRRLRPRLAGIDLVVGRYLLPTLKSGCLDTAPAILDIDDIDSHVYRARLHQPGLSLVRRLANSWQAVQISRLLPSRLRLFQRIFVCQDDPTIVQEIPRRVYLPNIPFYLPDSQAEPPTTRTTILFVGSFYHLPNEPAVDYFVKDVWPLVRARHPEMRFRIVGSNLQPAMKARWEREPGVQAVGFVENLQVEYAQCLFGVVPLQSVTGTNIKVLECLGHQRTCVISPAAQAGFAGKLQDGKALLVAGAPPAFAGACCRLIEDGAARETLALEGRRVVEAEFSYERFRRTVAETVEASLNGTPFPDPVGK